MRLLSALAVAGFMLLPLSAHAQDVDVRSVSQQLSQMQRQMNQMQRDMYKDGGAVEQGGLTSSASSSDNNAGLAAAMDSRLSALEGEIRRINGRLDEIDYANTQMKTQFDLFKSDLEVRLSEISGQKPAGTTAVVAPTPAPVTPMPAAAATPAATPVAAIDTNAATAATADKPDVGTLAGGTPATVYDQAFQALREQNYPQAEAGFGQFLKSYPKDPLAGNAKYWLGETYYARGDYTRAARVFAEGYQQYPKSSKGADNLLKLGLSLSQLNKKQEACVTFMQLEKDYKNAAAVIKQRAAAEKQKLACAA